MNTAFFGVRVGRNAPQNNVIGVPAPFLAVLTNLLRIDAPERSPRFPILVRPSGSDGSFSRTLFDLMESDRRSSFLLVAFSSTNRRPLRRKTLAAFPVPVQGRDFVG